MGLYFKNKTSEVVWVAYARHNPGCDGPDWLKRGWWSILPFMTKKVESGWVGGSKYFYFAEANDLSPAWSGPFFTHLPWNSFEWCWNTASTNGRTLGLRKLEPSWQYMDYTVGLSK